MYLKRKRMVHGSGFALHLMVVTRHADGIEYPDLEFARDDGGGDETAARDRDDARPRIPFDKAPRERFRIPVQLFPRYREGFCESLVRLHAGHPRAQTQKPRG